MKTKHEENWEKNMDPFFLTDFPNYTSPFWNMKQSDDVEGEAKKVDVITDGIETIGSENAHVIRRNEETISHD